MKIKYCQKETNVVANPFRQVKDFLPLKCGESYGIVEKKSCHLESEDTGPSPGQINHELYIHEQVLTSLYSGFYIFNMELMMISTAQSCWIE